MYKRANVYIYISTKSILQASRKARESVAIRAVEQARLVAYFSETLSGNGNKLLLEACRLQSVAPKVRALRGKR